MKKSDEKMWKMVFEYIQSNQILLGWLKKQKAKIENSEIKDCK